MNNLDDKSDRKDIATYTNHSPLSFTKYIYRYSYARNSLKAIILISSRILTFDFTSSISTSTSSISTIALYLFSSLFTSSFLSSFYREIDFIN